jgi:3'-5' exoribonuclease
MRVREFVDGCRVAQPLLVRAVERGSTGHGEHLELLLGDRTGSIPARAPRAAAGETVCRPGAVVFVEGTLADTWLAVHSLRPAREEEYAPEDLFDGPSRDADQMESDLRELLGTVQNPHLRQLLTAVFAEAWPGYREAPAAKRYHQAYRHGLLEHSLSVAQAVGAISATFPGIDRDVAVTGALLHDIGKLDAYELQAGAKVRSRSATTACGARSSDSMVSRPSSPRPCSTSSSVITARSSTAVRWCRAPGRRRSCT